MRDDEIRIDVATGEVRVNIVAMLKELGWEDTPANRDTLCRTLVRELRRRSATIKIVAVQGGGRQN